MTISEQTISVLMEIINEKSQYRKGPELVVFFNDLGSHDKYVFGQPFPSRKNYTLDKIRLLNGTSGIDECIKKTFDPRNFEENYQLMFNLIEEFNKHLMYDGWNIFLNGNEISFKKVSFTAKDLFKSDNKQTKTAEEFISIKIDTLNINQLPIDNELIPIIMSRMEEIDNCLMSKCPLATIFLCGSVLEGILFALASQNKKDFNSSKVSPKNKDGKVKPFNNWGLKDYIDVAKELEYIDEDVKKFSHVLQDFRNYIHPYVQLNNSFNPSLETAKLCVQVVKIAINQIGNKR